MDSNSESMSSHDGPPPLGDSSEDGDDGPPGLVDSSSEDEDAFRAAVMREDLENVEAILLEGGDSLSRACFHALGFQQRMTSLEYAVHRGAVPLAQLLFAHGARSRVVRRAAGWIERLQDLAPSTPRGGLCMHGFICLLRAATGEDPDAKLNLLLAVQAGLGSALSNAVRAQLRFLCLCLTRLGLKGGSMRIILVHVLLDCISACLFHGRFAPADLHSQPELEVDDSSTTPHTYLEFPIAWSSDWGVEVSSLLQDRRLTPEHEGARFFITTRYDIAWSMKDGTVPDESDFPLSVHLLDEHGEVSSSSGQLVEATPAAAPFEAPRMWVFSPPSLTEANRPEPTRPFQQAVRRITVPWSQDWGSLLSKAVAVLGMGLEDEGSRFQILNSSGDHWSLRNRVVPGSNEFPLSLHMVSEVWIMDVNGSYELEAVADVRGCLELRTGCKIRGRLEPIHNRFVRSDVAVHRHGPISHAFIGMGARGSSTSSQSSSASSQRQQAIERALPMPSLWVGPPAALDPSLSVTQDMTHDEPAAYISPEEAQLITQQVEAGLVQRSMIPTYGHLQSACITDTLAEDESDLPVSECVAASELATQDDFFVDGLQHHSYEDAEGTHASMTRLVLLNFTRHPPSFERALKSGEFDALRERQEALRRAGHPEVLPCGTKMLVSPADFSIARQSVVGKKLGPSFVIVSEELEPVVTAAVNACTKHREGVRVKNVETLAYVSEDDCSLIVSKTFLDLSNNRPKTRSVAHSTTAVHGHLNLNPRCFG